MTSEGARSEQDVPEAGPRKRRRWLRWLIAVVAGVVVVAVAFVIWYETTLYSAGPAQEGYLALAGATILLGDDLETVTDATILILDGVIVEAGPSGTIDLPGEATIIDITGYTVLPGLIDLHVHFGPPELGAHESAGWMDFPRMVLEAMRYSPHHRRSALEHGVTTVRSLGDDYSFIVDLRRQTDDGTLEGPRVFASGPLFTTPGGHPIATRGVDVNSEGVRVPATPDEARQMVRELATADEPVDLIKIVQERGSPDRPLEPVAPDVLAAIVDEAHVHGLFVTAHWGTFDDLADLLDAGVDGLEHLESRILVDGWRGDLLDELVQRDLPATATLAVAEAALPPDIVPEIMEQLKQRTGELHAAGGRVVAGSDAGMPGVPFGRGMHRELELLVEAGLTPREVLLAATVEAAGVLGVDNLGKIEPGCLADLVIVAGDPTDDVSDIRKVVMVFRDGRLVIDNR